MNKMGYYIYKYENAQHEIGYIGLTTNLRNRINDHKIDKVGDSEYKYIYYFECDNKEQMRSYEYYLINKYLPPLNIQSKNLNISISLEEPEWMRYEDCNQPLQTLSYEDIINKYSKTQATTTAVTPLLFFKHDWDLIHYRIIYCCLLKYRLTGQPLKNRSELLEMCGFHKGGGNYTSYGEGIAFLQKQGILSNNLELINFNPMENISNEQIFSLISSKTISKYDFLYVELLNYFNFQNFTIPLEDLKQLTGFSRTTTINQRAFPARLNTLWHMKLIYTIDTKNKIVCFNIVEVE